MDIRTQTFIVIKKNGKYLVGTILGSRDLRWSQYVFDAYRTRDMNKADALARKVGGIKVLFNRVSGDVRVIGA